MKNKINPTLTMAISMVIFGTIPLFVRNISVSSAEPALYRAVLAVFLILIFLLVTKKLLPLKNLKNEIILLFFSGSSVGINWILLFVPSAILL